MRLKVVVWGLGVSVFTGGFLTTSLAALADNIELQVFKSIDAQLVNCPEKITVVEQGRPYREGGFTIDGSAKLSKIADKFTVAAKDAFSVTWVAKLKPPFTTCKGTAGVFGKDRGSSHIRSRLIDGKIYLILDMTGSSDANRLTPAIVRSGVKNGNPFWSWSGTD